MPMIPGKSPFDPFDRTVRQMIGQRSNLENNTRSVPYSDQYIDDEDLVITMDIPGVEKEDIEATVHDENRKQVLLISAVDSQTQIERKFRQQIPLKKRVNPEDSSAEYNNGILTIRLPLEDSTDKGTDIQIS